VDVAGGFGPGRISLLLREVNPAQITVRKYGATVFLDQWVNVACAARPINPRDELSPDKVTFMRKNAAYLRGEPWDGRRFGLRAVRPMGTGEVIYKANLDDVPLVSRGDTLTLVYQGRNVRLRTQVEALADGGLGDMIPVRNPDSKREVVAEIRDAETVWCARRAEFPRSQVMKLYPYAALTLLTPGRCAASSAATADPVLTPPVVEAPAPRLSGSLLTPPTPATSTATPRAQRGRRGHRQWSSRQGQPTSRPTADRTSAWRWHHQLVGKTTPILPSGQPGHGRKSRHAEDRRQLGHPSRARRDQRESNCRPPWPRACARYPGGLLGRGRARGQGQQRDPGARGARAGARSGNHPATPSPPRTWPTQDRVLGQGVLADKQRPGWMTRFWTTSGRSSLLQGEGPCLPFPPPPPRAPASRPAWRP
jgi:flagella basal body P-ring formation protein FlgA